MTSRDVLNGLARLALRLAALGARTLVIGSMMGRLWVILALVAIIVVLGPQVPAIAGFGGAALVLAALVAILAITIRG